MRPGETLYGLYEGTPGVVYGADWVALPNKITLFRLPLEADFADPYELAEEVRRTVAHELAHHAGLDDARLHELGLD
jgi:predicted Zn-dependent protease with MMP-like domain